MQRSPNATNIKAIYRAVRRQQPSTWAQWHTQEKISGIQGYGRPRRGSGGLSPTGAGEFSKICKKIS